MNLSPKLKRATLITIQVAVSLLLLYLLFRNVDLAQAQQILQTTNLPLLGVSVVLFILSSFAIGLALHSALKPRTSHHRLKPRCSPTSAANY